MYLPDVRPGENCPLYCKALESKILDPGTFHSKKFQKSELPNYGFRLNLVRLEWVSNPEIDQFQMIVNKIK